ncbi:hypothetical protein PO124_15445 [Bacillus licheniformis]|nr:hypothetical protein [Bacillus licheniformis]
MSKDHLNWLDLRNDSHTLSPSYWCHGAPGICWGERTFRLLFLN